jgi:hypothetical protein
MRRIGSGAVDMVATQFCYTTCLRLSLVYLYAGSDIIYNSVFGKSVIILDKYETAVELLDKRSASYSNRYACVTPHSFRQG